MADEVPEIPTYTGKEAHRMLLRKWGLPNSCPRPNEGFFGRGRVLFVDDDDNGCPVAYWVPDEEKTV